MTILPGDTNKTFSPPVNGNYAVIITMGSCADTSGCWNMLHIGIPESEKLHLLIFPNPTSHNFIVKNLSIDKASCIQVINLTGDIIYKVDVSGKQEYLFGEDLVSGMYFLKVFEGEKQFIEKLVVE